MKLYSTDVPKQFTVVLIKRTNGISSDEYTWDPPEKRDKQQLYNPDDGLIFAILTKKEAAEDIAQC